MAANKKTKFPGVDIDRVHQRYRFGDPLQVMIIEEEKTCKGCAWKEELLGKDVCGNPARKSGAAHLRCKDYQEAK